MSDLIVITFDTDVVAFEMRAELAKLQTEYLIEMEDVVVVTRALDNTVKLHQAANLTALGAVSGGFWGALIGLLFLNPLLGAVVGAGAGALSGTYSDLGINDDFMRDLGAKLTPGTAAVFILVRKISADKVAERLATLNAKGHILQTSLSAEDEAKLAAAFADKPA
ncbi:MAG: DUF1269 domain-containing protein [Candidatus Saccharibacteria bacterium]|nr:DUF1269 domain-containing protein [Pseudorhodobacter sp.]